jgi:hypothetical protein
MPIHVLEFVLRSKSSVYQRAGRAIFQKDELT